MKQQRLSEVTKRQSRQQTSQGSPETNLYGSDEKDDQTEHTCTWKRSVMNGVTSAPR